MELRKQLPCQMTTRTRLIMNNEIAFIVFMVIVNFFCLRSIIRKLEILRITLDTTRKKVNALQDLTCEAKKEVETKTK